MERHNRILWEKSEEGQKAIQLQKSLTEIQKWLDDNGLKYTVVNANNKVLFKNMRGNLVEFDKVVAEKMSR